MVYTAIFKDSDEKHTYDIYDAPHGFALAWAAIEGDSDRTLVAIVPGKHEVVFRHNFENGVSSFSQGRPTATRSVS